MFRALREGTGTGARWPVILLALGFALLVAVAAATAWMVRASSDDYAAVDHTLEVQAEASRLTIATLQVDTGIRGYMLTRRPNYRTDYLAAMRDAPLILERLRAMTADNPRQTDALAEADAALRERLAFLRATIGLLDSGQPLGEITSTRTTQGNALSNRLHRAIARIQATEQQLLDTRRESAVATSARLLWLTIAALAVASLLAFAAVTSILRYARGLEGANRQVRSLNEGLEEKVAERTADLQAANDEIQRFAYIVSHDLRSPLVNVMGFTSELDAAGAHARVLLDAVEASHPDLATRDQKLAIREDLPEALGFIRTSTAKMDRLINAILKLSREGRRNLAAERVDMTALLRDIAKALHQQAEAAGATITVDALPDLVNDRLALDQVFGNLVENAVKYLHPGRPGVVRVTGKALGTHVQYTVEDNGRGIDRADQERVFDLFRRAGVQDRPGEGIGLAHVRALVRRLGGTIELMSELGRGSRFIVTLPRELKESVGA